MTQIIYARLVDGAVAEYPVYLLHIENRGHPLDWYTPVVFPAVPTIPQFYNLAESISVVNGIPTVAYSVTPKSLQQLLNEITPANIMFDPMVTVTPTAIADVDPALVARVATLATDMAEDKLNAFAATRGYQSASRAVGYVTSKDAGFAADGQRVSDLRDQMWRAFYAYMANVQSGATPVPMKVSEIEAQLPELTWA